MSDNRYYVYYNSWPTLRVALTGFPLGRLRDQFDGIRPRIAPTEQFDHAAIQCGKSSLLVDRQAQKIGIGDLLVAEQTFPNNCEGITQ